MILDALYNGNFRPGEMGFMDQPDYWNAIREIDFLRSTLLENTDQGDKFLLEQLIEQTQRAQAAACASSFQHGFSAGLLLMQEAQTMMREKGLADNV